ncbi:MAG: MBL fold metallo-hydrolase [Clostridia bacterium]|nr:MBL fold metallo-hydrolase [Clostridia bacterium]
MKYEVFTVGALDSNTYLVYEEKGGEAFVVDAGGGYEEVAARAKELGVKISAVLLTHGHFDHILDAEKYRAAGIRVGISASDVYMLTDRRDNLARYMGLKFDGATADFTFSDGDVLTFGTVTVKVVSTPGHTAGSCCFLCDNVCFSGDTLFLNSIGRTDFPTGDHSTLIRSIKEKLMALPDDVIVLPGHDEPTTVGEERRNNPYLEGLC